MTINFYRWKVTDSTTRAKIMRRAQDNIDAVIGLVQPIIQNVKTRGDDALREYARKFEKAELNSIKATPEEFDRAEKSLKPEVKDAIKFCAANVKKFHEEQMRRVEKEWMIEIMPGVHAGEKVTAIDSVGLYVPRGKGAFPSAMYMLCIPAVIAGVKNIAVVTPPTQDGSADDASLYTARLCGVENVYKVGGAQAIAALAFGTKTIPAVKKVLGPGSPYVAAAKRVLSDIIDPGMPAGPSESIILCDETADPHNTCLDILNEAEHGNDSAALLVTHDEKLANYVQQNLPKIIAQLPEPHRGICATVMQNYGGIILTGSLEESIAFSNEYAPEHLHVKLSDKNLNLVIRHCERSEALQSPRKELDCRIGLQPPRNDSFEIRNAGEILIGEYTPSTLGNYGIGVNHVLPTGGWAHTYSCTSVWDFLKRTSISKCDKQGFDTLKGPVETLTNYEGFPAHGDVLRKRNL